MQMTKTLKVRVKDKHAPVLREMARSVNTVWNYINQLSSRAIRDHGRFLSAFDMHKYTVGASKELGLHSHAPQMIAKEYVIRRKQSKKARLNWRVSDRGSSKYSLGWIPINTGMATWKNGHVYHNGHYFKVWDSYGLGGYKFRSASFNEDSRGRWYFNVAVDVEQKISSGRDQIGIDLGLKTVATCSDGSVLNNDRFYRDLEPALATAQRAGKKSRARAIHKKISNRRKDALHKFSRELVDRCSLISVGDIDPQKLVKTKMAKSVLDAGWGKLKAMLSYKCDYAGVVFIEVNESYTTQTCSCCGALPDSRPKGIAGLGIREWTCVDCGAVHDRDINAARNILAAGHRRLAVGISVIEDREDANVSTARLSAI